ncbi:tumor necrosis factor receptor superfamily member 1B-like isoform X2 [Haliotis asinina]
MDKSFGCQPCSQCSDGFMSVESCTNQSNTVCRSCELGTYSVGGLKCQNCSHCSPGTFVSRHCTLTSDTQCEPCAKNMYSSHWSAEFCIPCSRCGKAVTVETKCSDTHDYKCGDCIEGYYRHPNLPNTCIKCSYCYPGNPNVTVVVNECRTKSKDPEMRCMPVWGFLAGSLAKNRASSSTSSTTMSTGHIISSVPFLYGESYNVPIPPRVATAIIIVCVIMIMVILAILCILHKRKQLPKKSETINFLCQMCRCEGSDLKMKRGKEIPPPSLLSKQIEFVITSEPESTNSVPRRQAYSDEVPMVSCSQCLIHYGIGGGSEANQTVDLVVGQNQTRDKAQLQETCVVELDAEPFCPNPVHFVPNDSESNFVSSSGNGLPVFTSPSDREGGNEDPGDSVGGTPFANNNGFECEEALVTNPSPPVSISEMKEQNQGGSIQASEPLSGDYRLMLQEPLGVGSNDSDDSGLPCVQQDAAQSAMSRLVQRMDSGIAEVGTDTERSGNSSRHLSTAPPQTGACSVPEVSTSRDLQQPGSSFVDVSTDSEGSSQRTDMSSDYDSDVVDMKTLLDRGQTRPASSGRRSGRLKRKTRRHSNPGILGFHLSSGTLESYSKLDTFTQRD